MEENNSARARLLLIVDILNVYSNENNVLSTEEICSHLEKYGYSATKRSVVADIKSINSTPHKIIYVTHPKKGYYIVRDYTLASIDSLLTAVYSSDMLTAAERTAAEKIIRHNMSISTGDLLLNTTDRISAEVPRETVSWESVMTLRNAINSKKQVQISFTLTSPGDSFSSVESEESMTVNPLRIAISSNSILLVFSQIDSKQAECMHICRIKKVEILNSDAQPYYGDIADAKGYFTGSLIKDRHKITEWVFLKFRCEYTEFVKNFFDSPVQIRKDENEGYCIAKVYSVFDERLVGWLLSFSDRVEIIAPHQLRDYLIERAQTAIQFYSKQSQ